LGAKQKQLEAQTKKAFFPLPTSPRRNKLGFSARATPYNRDEKALLPLSSSTARRPPLPSSLLLLPLLLSRFSSPERLSILAQPLRTRLRLESTSTGSTRVNVTLAGGAVERIFVEMGRGRRRRRRRSAGDPRLMVMRRRRGRRARAGVRALGTVAVGRAAGRRRGGAAVVAVVVARARGTVATIVELGGGEQGTSERSGRGWTGSWRGEKKKEKPTELSSSYSALLTLLPPLSDLRLSGFPSRLSLSFDRWRSLRP
jgi:hypothetical protein